jgi:uncharacterized cupredoxin-like copper-binding protein
MRITSLAVLLAAVALPLSALAHGEPHTKKSVAAQPMVETDFGRTGDRKKVTRVIRVNMADTMRFTPATIEIRQGETVRFVIRNSGKTMHEMVLGTMNDLKEHAELMRKHPGMEHDEPYMVHVAPGRTAEIVWQFTNAGDYHYGCLIPGHLEAGMVGQLKVIAR